MQNITTFTSNRLVLSANNFLPRSDFTLRLIADFILVEGDCEQSLFIDAILRNCRFENINFSRSDFQGAKFEKCSFFNCNFQHADWRSSIIAGALFENCNFEQGFFSDCEFLDSKFNKCRWGHGVLTESNFISSNFNNVSFIKSSVVLNNFNLCSFENLKFGDCTFLFNLMKKCSYEKISMNAESVGYVYGLSKNDISKIGFIYLGREQDVPLEIELINLLESEYKNRNWHTGLEMLRLNFGSVSPYFSLPNILKHIISQSQQGIIVKKDELKFLERIVIDLNDEKRLPLFAAASMIDIISNYLNEVNSDQGVKFGVINNLNGLKNTLSFITFKMIDELEDLRLEIFNEVVDKPIVLRVKFEEAPDISIVNLINDLKKQVDMNCNHDTKLLKVEYGSVIEFIQTCAQGVFSFWLFLYGIEGCIVGLTRVRSRVNVLVGKNLPKPYKDLALSPTIPPSPIAMTAASQTYKFAKSLKWIETADQRKVNSKNIKEIGWQD